MTCPAHPRRRLRPLFAFYRLFLTAILVDSKIDSHSDLGGAKVRTALTACAIVDYQPFEDTGDAVRDGQGGTKLVVDGIEF
jgi:hypothetical protein